MAQIVATVGIDVSKDRLDVAVHPTDEQFSVTNDAVGWRLLVRRLRRLLAAGKKPKVAIVAAMRKLIVTLNAMVRDNLPWRSAAA